MIKPCDGPQNFTQLHAFFDALVRGAGGLVGARHYEISS